MLGLMLNRLLRSCFVFACTFVLADCLPLSAQGQDKVIRGTIRTLNGAELTAVSAATLQPGVTNFDVDVSGQVVGVGNAAVGRRITGEYDAMSGEYRISVPPPEGTQNLRIDLTMRPNTNGFQTVDLQRIALLSQTFDVVMPRNIPVPSSSVPCSSCGRRGLFRRCR